MERFLLLVTLAAVYSPASEAACTLDSLNSELPSLVARSLRTSQNPGTTTVASSNIVCLVTDTNRGLYKEASVIVNCTDSDCPTAGFLQVDLVCSRNWNPAHTRKDVVANLATPQRTDCGLCNGDAVGFPDIDNVTHCVACDSSCNTGLMECTGISGSECCIGVVNNMCVSSCTAPARPLDSAGYECTVFCDPLSDPDNGNIIFSSGLLVDSVATYSCKPNFEIQGDINRTCEIGRSTVMWSGVAPFCCTDCQPETTQAPTQVSMPLPTAQGNPSTDTITLVTAFVVGMMLASVLGVVFVTVVYKLRKAKLNKSIPNVSNTKDPKNELHEELTEGPENAVYEELTGEAVIELNENVSYEMLKPNSS